MSDQFANKANLSLHGRTWNAAHLDSFLRSQWGEKLFVAGKQRDDSNSVQLPADLQIRSTTDSRIRPSPAFLSLPREAPPAPEFVSARSTSDFDWTDSEKTKDFRKRQVDTVALAKGIHTAEERKAALQKESARLLPPPARRQLYEAEKKQGMDYFALKSQRLLLMKQQRILENAYPDGLIRQGTREGRSKVFSQSARAVARTSNLKLQRRTSPDVEFGNPESGSTSPVPPRFQLKRFPEIYKHHYHDTHQALFIPGGETQGIGRLDRLTQLTRGNRAYNIVSGTSY